MQRTTLTLSMLAALATSSACEFEGAAPRTGGADAGPSVDSIAPTWRPAERIVELDSSSDEQFPAPARQGMTLTFARTERRGNHLVNIPYRAHRVAGGDPFGPAGRLPVFGDTSIWDLEIRDDDLEWFFWHKFANIAVASRSDESAPLGAIVDLGTAGFSPSLSGDGLTLYYIDLGGELRRLTRVSVSFPWVDSGVVEIAAPFRMVSIDIASDELSVVLTADPSTFDAGVYLAHRTNTSESFGAAERIEALVGPFINARFGLDDREIFVNAPASESQALYRSTLAAE